jgi:hypothetical protein
MLQNHSPPLHDDQGMRFPNVLRLGGMKATCQQRIQLRDINMLTCLPPRPSLLGPCHIRGLRGKTRKRIVCHGLQAASLS